MIRSNVLCAASFAAVLVVGCAQEPQFTGVDVVVELRGQPEQLTVGQPWTASVTLRNPLPDSPIVVPPGATFGQGLLGLEISYEEEPFTKLRVEWGLEDYTSRPDILAPGESREFNERIFYKLIGEHSGPDYPFARPGRYKLRALVLDSRRDLYRGRRIESSVLFLTVREGSSADQKAWRLIASDTDILELIQDGSISSHIGKPERDTQLGKSRATLSAARRLKSILDANPTSDLNRFYESIEIRFARSGIERSIFLPAINNNETEEEDAK